ncbi:MAG: hypothetical protein GQ574_19770 [Crocinitomix sp.]|nr:hypothetical protein [Crocinitomix sp.]
MRNKYKILVFIFCTFSIQFASAQSTVTFTNIDSILNYAQENSATSKNSEQLQLLANWQNTSAKFGIVNFKIQTSFSLINNILLPVTFLPGEAFSGEPGTFKEVTTGQPYIGNLSVLPQIDLVNLGNWSKLKSTKINQELTEINNLITEKTLSESIAAAYYNILSLEEQIRITEQNLKSSDTLLSIVNNKYVQGVVRKQDLNDVTINKINLTGKLEQLEILLKLQYLGLNILCDIPPDAQIIIKDDLDYNSQFESSLYTDNQLLYNASLLKADLINADLRTNNFSQLPTLSLLGFSAWQQNSTVTFFDQDREWINSQYVGIKLNVPFPDINKIILSKNLVINREISLINAEHTKLYNEMTNTQMTLDYEKAISQLKTSKNVLLLKEENYEMAVQQFEIGILSTDRLLIAFNDLLISQLEYSSAQAALQFSQSKIKINNTIK